MLETTIGIVCLIGAVCAWAFINLAPNPISDRDKRYVHPKRKGVNR